MDEKELSTLLSKILSNFNQRLTKLEQEAESEVLFEKIHVPESQGRLGGELITQESKIDFIPFCDSCKKQLTGDIILCECGKKLCQHCALEWELKYYCPSCLKQNLPLSKKAFKTLLAVSLELTNVGEIKKLSKMRREEIKKSFEELLNLGYVLKEGLLRRKRITDDGLVALELCNKLYSQDADVLYFLKELKNASKL